MNIMGYTVFIEPLENLPITAKQVINTINPHSYITAKNDGKFKEALLDSDLLIPDGSGIVLAAKQIYNQNIEKIAGSDLHIFLLEKLNRENGKVFYMGASQNTLKKIEKKIQKEFPNITVQSYSPPFKPIFTDEDNEIIISHINAFSPDVLFIGMTAPKQEKWLHQHKSLLNFKVASSIGAVFDFYAGTVQRPSQFWLDLHLEWLPRLLKEPKRLWRRNFISTPLFLYELFLYKIGFKH
ncbi:MAG: WecB/TagA/CpsF family glycosyltransferase [Campylobacterales bacterium]|nr:WecB/TagA/CpsF family glycosyltransferase [Campylobacterales bacterium]